MKFHIETTGPHPRARRASGRTCLDGTSDLGVVLFIGIALGIVNTSKMQ
jgi:hypothetical protein